MGKDRELTSNTRILFFEVGTLGCAPKDFEKNLAERNHAELVSASEPYSPILRPPESVPVRHMSKGLTRLIGQKCINAVSHHLSKDRDVVFDRFVNTPPSRRLIEEFVSLGDIATVALDFTCTPREIVKKRLSAEAAESSVAYSTWMIAQAVGNRVIRPTFAEPVDIIIRLDGSNSTPDLFDQIEDVLDIKGLIND